MLRATTIGAGLFVLLLHPARANAQQTSIEAFYEDSGGYLAVGPASGATPEASRIATRVSPDPRRIRATEVRRHAPVASTTRPTMAATVRGWFAAIARGIRALTSRSTSASPADSDNIDVGCIVNASYPGDDVSVSGRLTVHGGGDSYYFDWSGSGSSTFGQTFVFSIPRSTETYSLQCHGDFMFSSISQIIPVDAYGSVPQTLTVPMGEFTQASSWDGSNDTVARFRATLEPEFVVFGGRWIKESTGQGGVTDFCHFTGSECEYAGDIPWMPAYQIPQGQSHYFDAVGWPPFCVGYYRTHNRAPCDSSTPQNMSINTRGGSAEPSAVYATNLLRSGITHTTVWNDRAGVEMARIWP
jgi:hypothetical protein